MTIYLWKFSLPICLENIDSAEIMLLLRSGSDYLIAKNYVSTGGWNKLIFSLSDFSERNSIDCIKIFVRGADGKNNIGSPTLLISEIKGLSSEHDSKYLSAFITQERYKNLYSGSIGKLRKACSDSYSRYYRCGNS